MKWLQSLPIASRLAYGPRHLGADAAVEPERRDVATAGAAAGPARGDPAAGPRAVHEAEVVRLDRRPRAAADRTAAAAAAAAATAAAAGGRLGDGRLRRGRLRRPSGRRPSPTAAERGAVAAAGRGRDGDHDPGAVGQGAWPAGRPGRCRPPRTRPCRRPACRPATTEKAFFVEASSIGWVKRTEIAALRSTSFVSASRPEPDDARRRRRSGRPASRSGPRCRPRRGRRRA